MADLQQLKSEAASLGSQVLTVVGHAIDSALGEFSQDVPELSDEARTFAEAAIENLVPLPARPFVTSLITFGDAEAQREEQALDATIVAALNVGRANVDAVLTHFGALTIRV